MSEAAEDLLRRQGAVTEYLRTAACVKLTAQITDFENNFFGPDFKWTLESMDRWLHSRSLFYAAACDHGEAGERQIRALASVLITGARSCGRLLNGEIAEYELAPWFLESDATPIFYFSSVMSDARDHLRPVYGNLLLDVREYLAEKNLKVYRGISVASGAIGYQHLTKNGFLPVEGPKYLGKYRFMSINAKTAKTEFWFQVLTAVGEEEE